MYEYDPSLFKTKMRILGVSLQKVAEKCFLTRQTIDNISTGRTYNKSTILLIGLVLDFMADEQGKMDLFYALEKD